MIFRSILTTTALAVIVVVLAACTDSSSAARTTTSLPSAGTSATTPVTTSAAPAMTTDGATRELLDRQAVQAAWTRFWQTYSQLTKIDVAKLAAAVDAVALDPIRHQMISGATVARAAHKTDYGYVVNRPYWKGSIAGSLVATLGDCQDQSHFGSMSTATGQKLTVGTARDNMMASLVKGSDGSWRVRTITYLPSLPC